MTLNRSKSVINLGKHLVEQLTVQDDMLASWMAHDIAGRIEAAEQAPQEKKMEAQNACAEAILALWSHRNVLPQHLRPLVEMEAFLHTLASLDVDRQGYRYHPEALRAAAFGNADEETARYLEIARGVDYAARQLIQAALDAALERVVDSTETWVELAREAGVESGPDIEVLRASLLGENQSEVTRRHQEKQLQDRLSRLEAFIALASHWADDLRVRLRRDETTGK